MADGRNKANPIDVEYIRYHSGTAEEQAEIEKSAKEADADLKERAADTSGPGGTTKPN